MTCNAFQQTGTIFKLIREIITQNVLTNRIWKNDHPPSGHVSQQTRTIFELVQDIRTTVLTKFREDCTLTVISRVLTIKSAPLLAAMFFQTNRNHFQTHQIY
ncbi:hypothetical protein DPMN_094802 [Dreissena polymorpha]|uniref:Uncharacterized protein n=1 Tax=Dreissena polymorpha TaxID=45954 RepID=A0A9D4R2Z6_DREPO|nr:hypothetical protein DPMN_094802 [Dreissena polymorpha]